MSDTPKTNSRRNLLKKAAGVTGLAGLAMMVSPEAEAAGMAKSAVQYQDKPKDGHRCDGCALYIPGSSATANGKCKAVAGSIAPQGWCSLWSPKAS
jgi:hypothetical protein